MWAKIINGAKGAFAFLMTGIQWWTVANKLIEYYMLLIELADVDDELEGEEKRQQVLDAAWADLSSLDWWPKFLSRSTFDAIGGWLLDRIVKALNKAFGHNWKKDVEPEYLEALEKEVKEILT